MPLKMRRGYILAILPLMIFTIEICKTIVRDHHSKELFICTELITSNLLLSSNTRAKRYLYKQYLVIRLGDAVPMNGILHKFGHIFQSSPTIGTDRCFRN